MAVKAQVTAAPVSCPRPSSTGVGSRAIVWCRARYRIPPGPGRGHRLGHGARTSGGCGTAAGPGSEASGPRPRAAADAGGTARFCGHAARRRWPRCCRRAPAAAGSPRCPPGSKPARGVLATGHGGPRRARPGGRQGLPPARPHHGHRPGRGWTTPPPVPGTARGKPADRAGKAGRSPASPPPQPVSLLMPVSGLDVPYCVAGAREARLLRGTDLP